MEGVGAEKRVERVLCPVREGGDDVGDLSPDVVGKLGRKTFDQARR